MKAVVALAGAVVATPLVRSHVAGADLTVGADGGARVLQALGLRVDVVTGDLDSLEAPEVAALAAGGTDVAPHPQPEYMTDAYAALLLARDRGATDVVMIGALGGERLDHGIAALLYPLSAAFRGCRIVLVDGWWEATLLRAEGAEGASVRFRGAPGDYVSLVPLSEVTGVRSVGLRYGLAGATLALGSSLGVSNALVGEAGGYDIGGGVALATHQARPAAG